MFTVVGGGIYAVMGVIFATVMLSKLMRTILSFLGLA